MEKQIVKPRLEWVDTAKGICILLVILLHTSENIMDYSQSVYTMLRYIRLPLYYTIAGLFVSIKDIHTFIVKKINRLIVPYCFFVLIGNVVAYIRSMIYHESFIYFSPFYYAITEDKEWHFLIVPVWFFVSLFDVYVIYMFVNLFLRFFKIENELTKFIFMMLLSALGFISHRIGIDLPLFIDTSLTSMLFFYFGHLIMNKTTFLRNDHRFCILLISSLLFLAFTFYFSYGFVDFYRNNIKTSFINLYLFGMSGVTGILLLSKAIKRIPVISTIGRYSIVYLGTHQLFINDIKYCLIFYCPYLNCYYIELITFILVIIISTLLCFIFLRTIPYLIAQKDIISINI